MRGAALLALICMGLASPAQGERRRTASQEALELYRQVQQLQYRLDSVASGQARVRYLQGGTFLASVGYLYGVYLAQERFTSGDVEVVAKGVVGTTGVIFGVGGLVTLLFPGEAEYAGDRYRKLPGKNLTQLKVKLDQGEAELRRIANRARVSNNIIGSGFLAVGLADLIWFLGTGPNHNLNFLAYLGGLYSAVGLAMMFIETPAEAELADYNREKYGKGKGKDEGPTASLGLAPQPGGATLGLALSF